MLFNPLCTSTIFILQFVTVHFYKKNESLGEKKKNPIQEEFGFESEFLVVLWGKEGKGRNSLYSLLCFGGGKRA